MQHVFELELDSSNPTVEGQDWDSEMLSLFTAVGTTRPQDPPNPSSYPGIILSE